MRLYLDGNLAKFDTVAESKGFKLTHFVDGLSETTFDRIKDWQNVLPSRLQADGKSLAEKGRDLIEDVARQLNMNGMDTIASSVSEIATLYYILYL